ncbi:glycosyltransferase [Flavobacterium sp.]|uniref:glycosyltransferase family protein n=1 Tax=Flavobacterium sp. TaxID=239 RepID=UPI0028BEBB32|nr:glycosyltransferase [Flavobacterium sp.]
MRILLLGEYSRLHNSLKEGLTVLGHETLIVASGDGFKNYPLDYSIKPKFCENSIINILRQLIFRVFKFDIALWEKALRFYFLLPKLKNFDIVQLINECPIQTTKSLELYFLKKIISQNKKTFLLSCGADHLNVKYSFQNQHKKSILQPYFKNESLKEEYKYVLNYTSSKHVLIHNYIIQNCQGIIASDFDYVPPLFNHPKFLGLIPNPINLSNLKYTIPSIDSKVVFFLGINRWNYHQKGIIYFEKALKLIQEKYSDKVEIVIVENLPYNKYIDSFNNAHIVLDQVFAHDQGYNALEAMAKGKVVFTGAEKEFLEHYSLEQDQVAINALPDVDYLVQKMSFLIENPNEIIAIGKRARSFIEEEHNYVKIAEEYLNLWLTN